MSLLDSMPTPTKNAEAAHTSVEDLSTVGTELSDKHLRVASETRARAESSSSYTAIKWACIVDAYSTGAAFGTTLSAAEWRLIHAESGVAGSMLMKSFRPDDFEVHLALNGSNSQNLASAIAAYRPAMVVPGTESGTPLAEEIAYRLGLPGNDPRTSSLRRNKWHMAMALKAAGIPAARQELVTDVRAAIRAAESLGEWPVVIKPVDAAGSEGVQVCHELTAVEQAFRAIYLQTNLFGTPNREILVQQYLRGQQYMINGVSIDGRHQITEIWREDRLVLPGTGILYDKEIMVPYEGTVQEGLIAYTKAVLDAVGVREGASHTELVLTQDGPRLLEVAARMQGGIESSAIVAAIGDSHLTKTMKRYTQPREFQSQVGQPYRIARTPMVVNLISKRTGVVRENNSVRLLQTLPSFHMISRTPAVGSYIERTVDLLTKCGHIYLLHEDVDQLQRDYLQIREWENSDVLIVLE